MARPFLCARCKLEERVHRNGMQEHIHSHSVVLTTVFMLEKKSLLLAIRQLILNVFRVNSLIITKNVLIQKTVDVKGIFTSRDQ